MNLKNCRVLLTGASGGIGSELALALAAKGARLALVGRRRDALERVLDKLTESGGEGAIVCGDLATAEGRQAIVTQSLAALDGIDILINAAGILEFKPLIEQSPASIERIFQTNVLGSILLTQAVLPHMLERRRGRIVNIGSTFGSIGFAYFTAYSTSKFALRGFSEALRRELADSGIGVSYIAPRASRTPINNETVMRMGEAVKMNMDEPAWVAARIVEAIEKEKKEAYIGFPESFFARLNALLPRLVDNALRKQNRIMGEFATGKR